MYYNPGLLDVQASNAIETSRFQYLITSSGGYSISLRLWKKKESLKEEFNIQVDHWGRRRYGKRFYCCRFLAHRQLTYLNDRHL